MPSHAGKNPAGFSAWQASARSRIFRAGQAKKPEFPADACRLLENLVQNQAAYFAKRVRKRISACSFRRSC
jgi:hypothetical protein